MEENEEFRNGYFVILLMFINVSFSGFGVIYKAKDVKFGNVCAVKVIQSGSMSEIQRKDLKSEIITMQTVQMHPNLVLFLFSSCLLFIISFFRTFFVYSLFLAISDPF